MSDDELLARAKVIDDKLAEGLASLIERHRAEVERLTREMDEKLAAVRATMSRLMDEREAAEAAIAAAEERVREECARIADNWAAAHGQTNWIGAAIRARKP